MVLDIAADGRSGVKMVVSYGGEIVRCPYTGKARYAGGENRIVRVGMSERLGEVRARLAALAGFSSSSGVRIRYALAGAGGDGLDTLHDVSDDHDLWVLVTRLCCCDSLGARHGRVRAFLSPAADAPPPERIRRRASSPLLLDRSAADDKEAAAATITREQSAVALYAPAAASPATPSGGGDSSASAAQVDLGFEALAEIAAAQRSVTGYAASSSVTLLGGGGAAPTGKADGGFDALTTIAVAQRSAAEHYSACRAPATCARQADSGFKALAAVAAEQSGRTCPPLAPVFLVPVPLMTVFFRAIPVYGCYVPAAVL